jgi:hypothetical protein
MVAVGTSHWPSDDPTILHSAVICERRSNHPQRNAGTTLRVIPTLMPVLAPEPSSIEPGFCVTVDVREDIEVVKV